MPVASSAIAVCASSHATPLPPLGYFSTHVLPPSVVLKMPAVSLPESSPPTSPTLASRKSIENMIGHVGYPDCSAQFSPRSVVMMHPPLEPAKPTVEETKSR